MTTTDAIVRTLIPGRPHAPVTFYHVERQAMCRRGS